MFKPPPQPVSVLPRERVRQWQRWQAHDLAQGEREARSAPAAEPAAEDPALVAARLEAERAAALEAELQRLREAARRDGLQAGRAEGLKAGHAEGHAKGLEDGLAQGRAQGLAEGQQAALQQAQALAAVLDHCHDAATQLHATVPASLVRLALAVAHQVVGQALHHNPAVITDWVAQLLHHEPVTDGVVKLHLHPDDATLVAAQLGPALADHQWRVVPDDTVSRGGCRLVTPLGELDATLQTRWHRACEATGLEPPWTLA